VPNVAWGAGERKFVAGPERGTISGGERIKRESNARRRMQLGDRGKIKTGRSASVKALAKEKNVPKPPRRPLPLSQQHQLHEVIFSNRGQSRKETTSSEGSFVLEELKGKQDRKRSNDLRERDLQKKVFVIEKAVAKDRPS